MLDGVDVVREVHAVLDPAWLPSATLSAPVPGPATQASPIRNILNIGIGGSDLGPVMAYEALRHYSRRELTFRFVSNVDSTDFVEATRDLDPAETLFIVSSKTFTTLETMTNARSAREWSLAALGDETAIAKHFVAVSTNAQAGRRVRDRHRQHVRLLDWVGGRYSLDSAIGLSTMIALGPRASRDALRLPRDGRHFRTTPLEHNLPVLMGLPRRLVRQLLRRPDRRSDALQPVPPSLSRLPATARHGVKRKARHPRWPACRF